MPQKKNSLTPEQQRERFNQTVRELADAGELNPTDAHIEMERLLKLGVRKPPESLDSSD